MCVLLVPSSSQITNLVHPDWSLYNCMATNYGQNSIRITTPYEKWYNKKSFFSSLRKTPLSPLLHSSKIVFHLWLWLDIFRLPVVSEGWCRLTPGSHQQHQSDVLADQRPLQQMTKCCFNLDKHFSFNIKGIVTSPHSWLVDLLD